MLEVSIAKKSSLRLNLTRPCRPFRSDATQVRQIIMNLVINAAEAIGDSSGIIVLSTGCRECNRAVLQNAWVHEELPEGPMSFWRSPTPAAAWTRRPSQTL